MLSFLGIFKGVLLSDVFVGWCFKREFQKVVF